MTLPSVRATSERYSSVEWVDDDVIVGRRPPASDWFAASRQLTYRRGWSVLKSSRPIERENRVTPARASAVYRARSTRLGRRQMRRTVRSMTDHHNCSQAMHSKVEIARYLRVIITVHKRRDPNSNNLPGGGGLMDDSIGLRSEHISVAD